jgi:hypothetical protein
MRLRYDNIYTETIKVLICVTLQGRKRSVNKEIRKEGKAPYFL